MAIVEVVPAQVAVGETFTISGTGYTHSGVVTVEAHSEDGNGGLSLDSVDLVADSSGILAADKLKIAAQEEGHVKISITDVTAAATHEHTVEVFATAGV
jgi:hypothetical protein